MMNSELMQRFQAAAETIRQRVGEAEIGVILGSGLGDYVDALQDAKYIDYKDIPGIPRVHRTRSRRTLVDRHPPRAARVHDAGALPLL